MKAQKAGLMIFWIGIVCMVVMGFVASWWVNSAYRYLSLEQVSETIWVVESPLFGMWATAIPIGAILAGVGMLLYVRSKSPRIWLFGIGVFVVLLIDILSKWQILPTPLRGRFKWFNIQGKIAWLTDLEKK